MAYKLDLANLANSVYTHSMFPAQIPDITETWSLLMTTPNGLASDYQGALYVNSHGGYAVVSRGTEISSGGDILADLAMGLSKIPPQYIDATAFLDQAIAFGLGG